MTEKPQRRKAWSIALGAGSLVLFLILAALNAFKLEFLSPASPQSRLSSSPPSLPSRSSHSLPCSCCSSATSSSFTPIKRAR